MSNRDKEVERISRELNPNKAAYLKALTRIPLLDVLPESWEDYEQWIEENPQEARLLEETINHISEEFSLHITPIEEQEK